MKAEQKRKITRLNHKIFYTLACLTLSSLVVAVIFAGCSKRFHNLPAFSAFPINDAQNRSVGRFKTTYLADQIHAYFRGSSSGPIAVATFVDIDNLYSTSTFGRILGEQLMSELSMRGYDVIEMRQSEAVQVMIGEGEFGLSREMHTLRNGQMISGLIVGTYAVSPVRVYLNARLVDPTSSIITSVGTVEMKRSKEISRLLRSNSFPQSLERIPVRHLGYTMFSSPRYHPYHWPPMEPPAQQPNMDWYDENQMIDSPEAKLEDGEMPMEDSKKEMSEEAKKDAKEEEPQGS